MKEQNPVLTTSIQKLALAGEQAGFTVEQAIEVLETGMSVETFLNLVCSQIELSRAHPEASCWEFHPCANSPSRFRSALVATGLDSGLP